MHVYWPKYYLYTTSWSQIICLNTPHRQFYVCSVQRYLPFRWVLLDIAPDNYGHHSPSCLLINTSHQFPKKKKISFYWVSVEWKCLKFDWDCVLITSVSIVILQNNCTIFWHRVSVTMITCIQFPNPEPNVWNRFSLLHRACCFDYCFNIPTHAPIIYNLKSINSH
jgi:hypothetical protein